VLEDLNENIVENENAIEQEEKKALKRRKNIAKNEVSMITEFVKQNASDKEFRAKTWKRKVEDLQNKHKCLQRFR
jgi:hypothetical protein